MKPHQVKDIFNKLSIRGFDKEVPLSILKQELSNYVGIDKYRLKYTVETLIELGYIEFNSPFVLTVHPEAIK